MTTSPSDWIGAILLLGLGVASLGVVARGLKSGELPPGGYTGAGPVRRDKTPIYFGIWSFALAVIALAVTGYASLTLLKMLHASIAQHHAHRTLAK